MLVDFVTIDKKDFKCIQFDDCIYFGQVQSQVVKGQNKLVRHGQGIQIYDKKQLNSDQQVRYEGHWSNDMRNGYGITYYEDGSIYEGYYRNDQRYGKGKSQYDGHYYEGSWKLNQMDGQGCFKHKDGHICEGNFINGFFQLGTDIIYDPHLSQQERQHQILQCKRMQNEKEESSATKSFYMEKTNSYEQVKQLIFKSQNKNRLPMIIFDQEFQLQKEEFLQELAQFQNLNYFEFDLRKIYHCKQSEDKDQFQHLITQVKNNLKTLIKEGGIFFINIDEDQQNENIQNDVHVDIRELYNPKYLPSQILNRKLLQNNHVLEQLFEKDHVMLSSQFQLVLLSKYRLNQNFDNKLLTEKFYQTFDQVVPTQNVDVIILVDN